MENIIEIKNLKKKYDDKFELGEIDITIPKGVIVGLIGETGAGKSIILGAIGLLLGQRADTKSIKQGNKEYCSSSCNLSEHR